MFERLELENFTVFEKASFEWAAGINVFVGANGTGKTHLLKLLYCLRSNLYSEALWAANLQQVFLAGETLPVSPHAREGAIGRAIKQLMRDGALLNENIKVKSDNVEFTIRLDKQTGLPEIEPRTASGDVAPVYLPPKEILSIAPGLLSLNGKYQMSLDEPYIQVLTHAYTPHLRQLTEHQLAILDRIESIIGGKVSVQGDVFFVGNRTMHLVAEGHRKLALIWQLIRNGTIDASRPLLWDEPEANLNPSLMQEVVKVLLLLAQSGVQIFVATHNYAFLRELDFQKGAVLTRFFALEKTDTEGVVPHVAERYRDIKPNKIADEYLRLYDLEIQRSLGEV